MIQIPTTLLDLDNNEGISSGDEVLQKSLLRKSTDNAKNVDGFNLRGDRILMPPELIVTSSQGQEITDRPGRSNLAKGTQKEYLKVAKPLSRRGSCQRHAPANIKQLRQGGDMSDPEGRTPTEINIPFKQQFWKVLSNDNLPWSTQNTLTHEQLLKACSMRLAELKRRHKTKKEKLEQELSSLPSTQIKRKNKQRRTKSMRYERTRDYQLDNNEVLKIKPYKSADYKKVIAESPIKTVKKTQNKKFRKGGLVSLATVNTNRVGGETGSADESFDNATSKKKKKKRKILQLQKHMKTAVSAVTAITISKKESNKAIIKKKL